VREVDVAPAKLVHVDPWLAEYCHCTVGVGSPDAAAVNVADRPSWTDWFTGWSVTTGATGGRTVSVAALVVADPTKFVNTARNSHPLTNVVAVPLMEVDVVPAMLSHVVPWSTETCHCTLGVGSPLAPAVKVMGAPMARLWLAGSCTTVGPVGCETVNVKGCVAGLPTPLDAVRVML
jgi:hypothetical protein